MTKEELEKEAEEKGREWEHSILPKCEEDYVPYAPHYPYSKGYIAGAEPREKRIAELEAQIEKMKCCMKCEHWYYYKSFCDKDNSHRSEGQSCEHFILRR